MSRLTRLLSVGGRWLAIAVPIALGACTTVVEGGGYHHRSYHHYGPGFGRPVVVMPAPRAYYHDRYQHHDWHRHHRRHDRHHRHDRR